MFPKFIGAPLGLVLFAAALVGAGCGSSGTLRVTKVAVSTQRPGNIAFYLDVRDNGKPVAGLQEKDFKVYEDGKLVSSKKGKRALLEAEGVGFVAETRCNISEHYWPTVDEAERLTTCIASTDP